MSESTYFFLKVYFIIISEADLQREGKAERKIFCSLVNSPSDRNAWSLANQKPETSFICPDNLSHLLLLTQAIGRKLDWKWDSWDMPRLYTDCWHYSNRLSLLCHDTNPLSHFNEDMVQYISNIGERSLVDELCVNGFLPYFSQYSHCSVYQVQRWYSKENVTLQINIMIFKTLDSPLYLRQ